MVQADWIRTIKKLIEICKDGEHGYKEAARNVVSGELRRYFEEQSSTRSEFAEELRTQLSRLINRDVHGSIAAAVHRSWLALIGSFRGGDNRVLTAVRRGEDRAIAAYEAAISEPLPPQLEQLARRQLDNVRGVYNKLGAWEVRRAA